MSPPSPPASRRRIVRGLTLLALLALATPIAATVLPGSANDTVQALRADLARALERPGWRSARWSVLAVSLDTGDTLFAREPEAAVTPASNMKLLTTAAALHHVGPDFRYRTLVVADGPVEGGVLRGDLVLYGTGDPGLSDRFHASREAVFEMLADRLLAAGIAWVDGDLVGDGSFFEGPLLAEGWDASDLNDWFAAPASALSFNENVVTFRVEPGPAEGTPPIVHTLPENARVPVDLQATTGRGRFLVKRESPEDPVTMEGAIPAGGREVWRQMTVTDPTRYAVQIFLNVLERKGVGIRGTIRTVLDPAESVVTGRRLWAPAIRGSAPRVVASHLSPPLIDYLEVVNKRSHNLLAETTLKTLGRLVEGEGSYAAGSRVLERFLADHTGTDTTRVQVVDGSGLSELNRLAAGDLVRLLAWMSHSQHWEDLWATLPEAGDPRELRRMYRTAAAGNLRAKTGTIDRVSALSGVVTSAAGERIAFSIIANDVPSTWAAKQIEDRMGVRLAGFERSWEPAPLRMAGMVLPGQEGPESDPTPGDAGSGVRPELPERVAAAAEEEAVEARTHLVRSGENLTVIARRYGVSVNELAEANDGISPRTLQAGAEIRIPGRDPAEPAPAERTDPERHRVAAGENFTVIARRYGVSLNDLLEANPGVTPRNLRAGQWIDIPAPTSSGN